MVLLILVIPCKITKSQEDSLSKDHYKIFRYPNGNIASEGFLINNKPTGFWISYYITGVKKSEGKWNNNLLDSTWIFYDQLGDTIEKINYYLGKKNGYHFSYFVEEKSKNELKCKELYVNGKKNDDSYFYYPGGNVRKVIPYQNNKKQGVGFEYDPTGRVISITRYRKGEIIVHEKINRYNENGGKEGTWKEFYENGNLKIEKNYTSNKLDGYVKRYNIEGQLVNSIRYEHGEVDVEENSINSEIEIKETYDDNGNLIFQGSFKGKIPVGIHRSFNEKGAVISAKTYDIKGDLTAIGIVLPNGWENGKWAYYYQNGKKKAEGNYINGKKTGKWTFFYINGRVEQTGSYSAGKLSGFWRWYYKTGELLKEEYYIYGRSDGESIEYSVLGEIIAKGNYVEGYKEGKWTYLIGDQKYEGMYVMGQKDGTWKSFYIDEEKLSFEGRYVQGNPEGRHEYYYPDGSLKEEQFYSNGQKVRAWSKYDEYGSLIIVVQYREGLPYKINGVKVNLNKEKS